MTYQYEMFYKHNNIVAIRNLFDQKNYPRGIKHITMLFNRTQLLKSLQWNPQLDVHRAIMKLCNRNLSSYLTNDLLRAQCLSKLNDWDNEYYKVFWISSRIHSVLKQEATSEEQAQQEGALSQAYFEKVIKYLEKRKCKAPSTYNDDRVEIILCSLEHAFHPPAVNFAHALRHFEFVFLADLNPSADVWDNIIRAAHLLRERELAILSKGYQFLNEVTEQKEMKETVIEATIPTEIKIADFPPVVDEIKPDLQTISSVSSTLEPISIPKTIQECFDQIKSVTVKECIQIADLTRFIDSFSPRPDTKPNKNLTTQIDTIRIYSKRPFSGPETVLGYLSRYTHRVAISNRRLIAADKTSVTFKYKDYRIEGPGRYKTMTLEAGEFIRRFLIHVLPKGFHRIRHYGFLASGVRADNLATMRILLAMTAPAPKRKDAGKTEALARAAPVRLCPCCGSRMLIIETFEGSCRRRRPALAPAGIDTS